MSMKRVTLEPHVSGLWPGAVELRQPAFEGGATYTLSAAECRALAARLIEAAVEVEAMQREDARGLRARVAATFRR